MLAPHVEAQFKRASAHFSHMSALHNLEAGVPYLIVIVMVWGSPSRQHPRVTKKSRMHARKEYSTVIMKSIIDSRTIHLLVLLVKAR
jgi:hypothetical protein